MVDGFCYTSGNHVDEDFPLLFLDPAQMNALTERLLEAAQHPHDPASEVQVALAEFNVLPECARVDVEEDRRGAMLKQQNEAIRAHSVASDMLMQMYARPSLSGCADLDRQASRLFRHS